MCNKTRAVVTDTVVGRRCQLDYAMPLQVTCHNQT